jgi:hypothetical protein
VNTVTTDGPSTTAEDTNPLLGGKPVEVNVDSLTTYAGHMQQIYINSLGPTSKAFADIPGLLTRALTLPNGGVPPLGEGVMMNQYMDQRRLDFQSFFADMTKGIQAIANASQVIAYCFDNTDGENGANIDQVAFAFADPGSKKPAGFNDELLQDGGKVTTMWDQAEAARAAAAGQPASLAGLYGNFDGSSENRRGDRWEWPDGTYAKADYSSSYVPTSGAVWTTTTYTIYDKNGNVLGTRVTRSSSGASDGSKGEQLTISQGGSTQDTSTTINGDGSVTTSHTNTAPGQTKPDTSTVTVGAEDRGQGDEHGKGDQGPVESATTELGTQGTQYGQQEYGYGY